MADEESRTKDEALKRSLNTKLQQLELALATPTGSKTKNKRKKWTSMESLRNNYVEPKRSYGDKFKDFDVLESQPTHAYAVNVGQYTKLAARPSVQKELYSSDNFLTNLLENIKNSPSTTYSTGVKYPTTAFHGRMPVDQSSNVEILPGHVVGRPGAQADFYIKLPHRSRGPTLVAEDLVDHIFGERPNYLMTQGSALPYTTLSSGQHDYFPTDALAVRWAHQKLYEI
jgi:hypothetical protein